MFFSPILVHLLNQDQTTYQVVHALVATIPPILVHLLNQDQTTYQVVHALVAAVQRVVARKVGYCQFLVVVVLVVLGLWMVDLAMAKEGHFSEVNCEAEF